MRDVISVFHLVLMASITRIHTKVLRFSLTGFGTFYHQAVKRISQQLHIMCVYSGEDHSQRQPIFIRQNRTFCPQFSSVRRIFSHRLQRERRLDHAAVYTLPTQYPPTHHTTSRPAPIFPRKNLPFAILEICDEPDSRSRIPAGPLSTGSLCAEHKIFPPAPSALAMAVAPALVNVGIFFADRVYAGVCIPQFFPIIRLILSMIL